MPPVLVLLYTSFLPFFILPSDKAIAAFRLDNYAWILSSDLPSVLVNNIMAGVSAALCTVLLATLVSASTSFAQTVAGPRGAWQQYATPEAAG